MSAIRSFLGKLPRPSRRQAALGATAASAAAAGIWYLQQKTDKPAPAGKLGAEKEVLKKEAQRPGEEPAANKAQPAGEEAVKQKKDT
ncbi:hypothetical protein D1007_03034 [Hordeum vulgare]|nr:hypothetical protein D1007_03034 [Hordeum vulgare]KAI5012719.1 hypothetical protein ZWY2020_024985 [Hordeum vulgare]